MKVAYCGCREWALEIYKDVWESFAGDIDFVPIYSKTDFEIFVEEGTIDECDLIFFVGWSWIVEKIIVDNYTCICLHPSPLPKYRGGSPIQNQIINGEMESAVTYFVMNDKIDQGDIIFQSEFSLDGDLVDVFKRIVTHGRLGMEMILSKYLRTKKLDRTPQDESQKTYYKRRTPDESVILEEDFDTAEKLYNKIRALQSPYPNAYIVCRDGKSVYITKASLEDGK